MFSEIGWFCILSASWHTCFICERHGMCLYVGGLSRLLNMVSWRILSGEELHERHTYLLIRRFHTEMFLKNLH